MAAVKEREQLPGERARVSPVCDDFWIDYEELYDELFSRAEQSIGAQLHPVDENKDDGGDS